MTANFSHNCASSATVSALRPAALLPLPSHRPRARPPRVRRSPHRALPALWWERSYSADWQTPKRTKGNCCYPENVGILPFFTDW